MMGYPSMSMALFQGLLVALVLLTPWLMMAFATRLKTSGADVLLLLPIYPVFALLTLLVFLPFEGDWADMALGPVAVARPVLVGALAVLLGTLITQRRGLASRSAGEIAHQLGASLVIGAGWGLVWGLSGWFLNSLGMANNG